MLMDFEVWNALLQQYVNEHGQVDYQAWKTEQPQTLKSWLNSLESISFESSLTRQEQLALWINLYNAFMVATILERYPIDSIRPVIWGIPNWVAFLRLFQRRMHRFSRQIYSLSDIENSILRGQLQEPRIHFALVCASIGCPLLRAEAYRSGDVEQQLTDDAKRFINNPDKVRYNAPTGTLYCSKIFKWYRQDFLKVAGSVPEYIRTYLRSDTLAEHRLTASTSIAYLDYDWHLNQRTNQRTSS